MRIVSEAVKPLITDHAVLEVTDGDEDEAARDVEDAPERLGQVGHGQQGDPDGDQVGDGVGVLEEGGVAGTEREAGGLLAGVVETAGQ